MFLSLDVFMKQTVVAIFLAIILALSYSSLEISVSGGNGCAVNGTSADAGGGTRPNDGKIEDMAGFHGFTAYNVLNGTSVKIQSADRPSFVFRNTSSNVQAYNPATSKRLLHNALRSFSECCATHFFPGRYSILKHNAGILDRGMSSNSERIHFLRILIV